MILAHVVEQMQIGRAVDIQEIGPHPDHEELSDFFFQRKLAQRFLRPLLAVAIKMDGAGMLEFIFGLTRHAEGKEQKQNRKIPNHGRTIARSDEGVSRQESAGTFRKPCGADTPVRRL